jgi:hypothetical protein
MFTEQEMKVKLNEIENEINSKRSNKENVNNFSNM